MLMMARKLHVGHRPSLKSRASYLSPGAPQRKDKKAANGIQLGSAGDRSNTTYRGALYKALKNAFVRILSSVSRAWAIFAIYLAIY